MYSIFQIHCKDVVQIFVRIFKIQFVYHIYYQLKKSK